MVSEGRGGLLGSTQALCILSLLVLLLCVWSTKFSSYEGISDGLFYGKQTKLYMFGYGHNTLYFIWSSFWWKSNRSKDNRSKDNKGNTATSQQGKAQASKILLMLTLLAGDIHLNPGPSSLEKQASSVEQVGLGAGG